MNRKSFKSFISENREKLRILGIELRGINTVRFHPYETLTHRLVKFLIAHHLFEQDHYFKTEQPIKKSWCDVIDLNDFVIYEIETNINGTKIKKKLEEFYHPFIEDIIFIDTQKLKCDWLSVNRLFDAIKLRCGLR